MTRFSTLARRTLVTVAATCALAGPSIGSISASMSSGPGAAVLSGPSWNGQSWNGPSWNGPSWNVPVA